MRRWLLLGIIVIAVAIGLWRWRVEARAQAAEAKELRVFAGVSRLQDEGHHARRAARRGEADTEDGDDDSPGPGQDGAHGSTHAVRPRGSAPEAPVKTRE